MLSMQNAPRLRIAALITLSFLTACSQEPPTAESVIEEARGPSGPVGIEVAMLPGADHAYANDVNADGIVVGESAVNTQWKAFVVTASGPILLSAPGMAGSARGISEGPTPYVVGTEGSVTEPIGVRWRLTNPISREELGAGSPADVNASGIATGSHAGSVAIWSADGSMTLVPPPVAGYVDGTGNGINESGHIVANYWQIGAVGVAFDTWVRAPDGRMALLPPAAGDVSTQGMAVSEVVGSTFHVTGTTRSSSGTERSARWTIDATSLAAAAPLIITSGSASGVNRAGALAGTQMSRLSGTPYFWSNGMLQKLKLPRGGSDGRVTAMSDGAGSPIYVVGTMKRSNQFRGVLWRIQ